MKPEKIESEPCDECGVDTLKLLAERDTLQSKLTEMEQCLSWCSENVVSTSVSEDGWWVSVATNGTGSCKFHNLDTLYLALKSAWEGRDK